MENKELETNKDTNQTDGNQAPHLTPEELESFYRVSRLRRDYQNTKEWQMFVRSVRSGRKFQKDNVPLTINEKGEVVENHNPKPAPIARGNIRKGNLLNKKCSCGSGKKYKKCCLLRKS